MDTLLIKAKPVQQKNSPAVSQVVDRHFKIETESNLLLEPESTDDLSSTLQYLNLAIIKTPKNLRLHIQRVFLLLENQSRQHLPAALIDLFIVTRKAGVHLKQELLGLCLPLLNKQLFDYLSANCEGQLTAQTAVSHLLPAGSYSVLSQGLIGSLVVIKREIVAEKLPHLGGGANALHQQALECMEYGQLEEALTLLLQARSLDPEIDEISVDLLSIYISLGMKAEQEALLNELQVDIE